MPDGSRPDARGWLRHGAWRDGVHPLRRDVAADGAAGRRAIRTTRSFRVDGDGVHEIAVGPVHAGTIEPGHFRFSVVGERVLRLEEHLGYKHKGIEKRFETPDARGGRAARRPRVRRQHRGLRLGLCHGAREHVGRPGPRRARSGCARCCSSASASPTTSATSASSATTAASRSDWRSSRA